MPAKIKLYCSKKRNYRAKSFIIYDASIVSLEERKANALTFDTGEKAAEYLGLRRVSYLTEFTDRDAILKQKRYKSHKQNKIFIIRELTTSK